MGFKEAFKKERIHIYLAAILGVLAVASLLDAVCGWSVYSLISLGFACVLTAILALVIRNHRKKAADMDFVEMTEEPWRTLFDRYARRSVNWLLIVLWWTFGLGMNLATLGINSRANEMLTAFAGNRFTLEAYSFFLVKNLLIFRWLNARHAFDKRPDVRKEYRWVLLTSLSFLVLGGGLFFAFEKVFVLNISAFLTAAFAVWIVIYNFTRINRFTYERKRHNRVVMAVVLLALVLGGGYMFLSRDVWLTQPYINAVPNVYESDSKIAYDDETGIYTITKGPGDFKLLQLTDIHLGGGVLSYDKDLKALKACYALLQATQPDLVVITGDLSYPVGLSSFSFNNTAPVQQFATFMRLMGVPWAFTYGNHDTESYAATSKTSLNELYKSLSYKTSKTLLYPYVQPNIWGRNNQLIEVRNPDGSLNQGLFLIDSNAYTGEGLNKYDYIHDDQVAWYREQVLRMNAEAGRTVPSLVFFHIPLQQYKTAYELYTQGSSEVTWHFGSNDEKGSKKVCCSEYPSSLFDVARELGSTTGFFCGHDHYNNMSLEYQGLRLTYGMSIDYLVEPGIARDTKQRGATLITIHEDGTTDIVQVPLTSLTSEP